MVFVCEVGNLIAGKIWGCEDSEDRKIFLLILLFHLPQGLQGDDGCRVILYDSLRLRRLFHLGFGFQLYLAELF